MLSRDGRRFAHYIDTACAVAATDFDEASRSLKSSLSKTNFSDLEAWLVAMVAGLVRSGEWGKLTCILYLCDSAFSNDVAISVARSVEMAAAEDDDLLIAIGDIMNKRPDGGAIEFMRRRWSATRSTPYAIKLADFYRDAGRLAEAEAFLRLHRAGRHELTVRLAEHYVEFREWRSAYELLRISPLDQLSAYELYMLGRCAVSLLISSLVGEVVDMLKSGGAPGPKYGVLLESVWLWRIGGFQQDAGGTEGVSNDLPYLLKRDENGLQRTQSASAIERAYLIDRPSPAAVNVLAIGAQRTATSWLWRRLQAYPEVQPMSFKETVFFSDAFQDVGALSGGRLHAPDIGANGRAYWLGPTRNINASKSLFDRSYPVRADVSPTYCELPEPTVEHIALTLGADVKIVFSIRDPVERAWSNLACDWPEAAPETLPPGLRLAHYLSAASRRRCDYGAAFRIWTKYFNNVHVVVYDDVKNNPDQALRDVEAFLNLRHLRADALQAETASPVAEMLPQEDRAFLFGLYEGVIADCEALFGGACLSWRERHASVLNCP